METNDKLLSSFFNLSRLIRQKMFLDKCFCDLSHSEIEVLMFLEKNKKTTMKSISDYLRIKPSSITPVIDKLNTKKFLKRIADAKDRRITYIALTQKGIKELREKHQQIHKDIKKIFGKLSENNKKELIKILNVLLKNHE